MCAIRTAWEAVKVFRSIHWNALGFVPSYRRSDACSHFKWSTYRTAFKWGALLNHTHRSPIKRRMPSIYSASARWQIRWLSGLRSKDSLQLRLLSLYGWREILLQNRKLITRNDCRFTDVISVTVVLPLRHCQVITRYCCAGTVKQYAGKLFLQTACSQTAYIDWGIGGWLP